MGRMPCYNCIRTSPNLHSIITVVEVTTIVIWKIVQEIANLCSWCSWWTALQYWLKTWTKDRCEKLPWIISSHCPWWRGKLSFVEIKNVSSNIQFNLTNIGFFYQPKQNILLHSGNRGIGKPSDKIIWDFGWEPLAYEHPEKGKNMGCFAVKSIDGASWNALWRNVPDPVDWPSQWLICVEPQPNNRPEQFCLGPQANKNEYDKDWLKFTSWMTYPYAPVAINCLGNDLILK